MDGRRQEQTAPATSAEPVQQPKAEPAANKAPPPPAEMSPNDLDNLVAGYNQTLVNLEAAERGWLQSRTASKRGVIQPGSRNLTSDECRQIEMALGYQERQSFKTYEDLKAQASNYPARFKNDPGFNRRYQWGRYADLTMGKFCYVERR
jgi:hypothetical protein